MELNWKSQLGYVPEAHFLARNWSVFIFRSEEDCGSILRSNWSWGSSGLVLKKLSVDFDPEKEPMAVKRIWAIQPGLPLVFWSKDALETLGNKLGSFVGLEANWETKHDCRWAWINIELDVW